MIEVPPDQPYQSAGPVGFTPQQIRTAYGIDQLYGIIGDGSGQTIAIVDAYDDPNFVDSTNPNFLTSDLHQFDAQFGLPDPPSFTKRDQNGGTSLPGTDPAGAGNPNFEGEEALDVEWAHAIAPGANIILFEANSASPSDLNAAAATAANTPGVSVVSMSFGGAETSSDPSDNSIFTTPSGHNGVTFLASTGDNGSPGGYPAYSPNVVAVGGTNLTLNANNSYNSETGWGNGANSSTQGGSGGGISQFETEPAFQQSVQNTGFRTIPDVAFVADPATGVAVYDSYNNGTSTPWDQVGGTSLACPCWGGLIAIADQGLAQIGVSSLDGSSETLPDLYKLAQTKPGDFHDITSGNNGSFSAGPGYDEVTGLGSPVANLLIPDLEHLHAIKVHDIAFSATEGQALNSIPVATFNGVNGSAAGDFTATITWGDGAVTTGTVVDDGNNTFSVLGSHTYINAGTYTFTVSVQDTVTNTAGSDTIHVNVADAPLLGFGQALNSQVGGFLSNVLVGVFTDTDPTVRSPGQYSATIEWFEGNGLVVTSPGRIVSFSGNTFEVFGDDPFSLPSGGLFPVEVVVTDLNGGASVTINSKLSVASNPAIPPGIPQFGGDTSVVTSQFATMEDALTNLLLSERLFLESVAFGTLDQQQHGFSNLVNAFFAYQAAVFSYDMSLPM